MGCFSLSGSSFHQLFFSASFLFIVVHNPLRLICGIAGLHGLSRAYNHAVIFWHRDDGQLLHGRAAPTATQLFFVSVLVTASGYYWWSKDSRSKSWWGLGPSGLPGD